MTLATKTICVVPLGTTVNLIGTRRVAAVCQVGSSGEYRCVWITGRAGNGGPQVFWASLNAEKWRAVSVSFDLDDAGAIPGSPAELGAAFRAGGVLDHLNDHNATEAQ